MTTIKRKPVAGARRHGGVPTIADVAVRAGVSPMTVSRVINGEANVRAATRQSVTAAIAALNYTPNSAARSLAGGGQKRVGLLYSNPSSAYLSEFLVGSLDGARRSDVQLIVEKCEVDEHEAEVAQRLIDSGVDGVMLPPPLSDSAAVLAVLAAAEMPTVVVATGEEPHHASSVRIDDFRAAFEMTRHMLGLGHRRIGFVTGNPNQTASAQRLAGFRAALADAGIAADDALIAQGSFSYRSGLDAAEPLLARADPPSAIFASNDDMAAAIVALAHRRGLDVPGDLTVCGFDDTALASTIWPELTTIHQPIADMSRAALDVLVAAIQDRRAGRGETPQHLLLEFTVIRRQSDAVPRSSD